MRVNQTNQVNQRLTPPLQGPDGDNGRDGAPGAAGLPGADVSEARHSAAEVKTINE